MSYLASWIDPVQTIATVWGGVALEAAVKGTILLLLALAASRLAGQLSAAGRHLIWATCIVTLLALPALGALLPDWAVNVPRIDALPTLTAPRTIADEASRARVERQTGEGAQRVSDARRATSSAQAVDDDGAVASRTSPTTELGARDTELGWTARLFLLWAAGGAAVVLYTLTGLLALARTVRRSEPISDARWAALAHSLATDLGVRRRVRLMVNDDITVPMTCGVMRSAIVLPADAAGWTAARMRVVLLHELAHVRRHDCLAQLVTHIACALYWFHPLMWYASARLRNERERACDDAVLRGGAVPSEYASQLLDMARSFRSLPPAALAMARPSQLEGRLLAILASSRDRRVLSRRLAARLLLAACCIALPIAALTPRAAIAVPLVANEMASSLVAKATERAGDQSGEATPAAPSFDNLDAMAASPDSSADVEAVPVDAADRAEDIIFHPRPSDPLRSRLEWAREEATRRSLARGYWIGYAIPVSRGGRGIASGSDGWELDELNEPSMSQRLSQARRALRDAPAGLELPDDSAAAILIRYASPSSELGRPAALKVRTLAVGVELEGRPVIWLGGASDEESLPFLTELYAGPGSTRMKQALISAISVHRSSDTVVAFLFSVLGSDATSDLRAQAAEGLGYHDTREALDMLRRVSTADPSSRVREEAVEALGEMQMPESLDALLELVKTVEGEDVRLEAVEALGEKNSDRAAEALTDVAMSDRSTDVQREAVETLGEVPEQRGLAHLLRLARSHPNPDVRREVAETLAELPPSQRVLDELRRMAYEDAALSVQKEAVESIADVESGAANRLLEEIARDHPNAEVREEAREKRRG